MAKRTCMLANEGPEARRIDARTKAHALVRVDLQPGGRELRSFDMGDARDRERCEALEKRLKQLPKHERISFKWATDGVPDPEPEPEKAKVAAPGAAKPEPDKTKAKAKG